MKAFTRRDFLKISSVTAAGLTLSQLGFDLSPAQASMPLLSGSKEPRKPPVSAATAQLAAA